MSSGFNIVRTENAGDLPIPKRMTPGASGFDLYANVTGEFTIEPGDYRLVPCGVKISMPLGYEAQLRPRSGLAKNFGVTVLNAPGTIDSDYRGEICALLINHGKRAFAIKRGDRIAQLVICRVETVDFLEADTLDHTERGEGGYGHTGIGREAYER